MTVDYVAAALALIRLTAFIVARIERYEARQDGFREAVALEYAARSRAMRKGSRIDAEIDLMSDEEVHAALDKWRVKYRRSKLL